MLTIRFTFAFSIATLLSATTYNCTTFTVPGAASAWITGINNAGLAVGGYMPSDGYSHGSGTTRSREIQVKTLVTSGAFTAAQGQGLTDAALAVMTQIGC